MRRFHHGGFVVRPDAGIKVPKDLESKKAGVRAYSVTTGVWTRGIFTNEYGLDADKVTWVVDDEEHVTTMRLPDNVIHAPPGQSLAGMMASGELQAGFTGPAGIGRAGAPTANWEQGGQTPAQNYPELIRRTSPTIEADLVSPHRHLSDPRHHRGEDRSAEEKSAGIGRALLCRVYEGQGRPTSTRLKRGDGTTPTTDIRYRSCSSR